MQRLENDSEREAEGLEDAKCDEVKEEKERERKG